MAYRDDRSLEELIAGSIENKKKKRRVNVVKARPVEQKEKFNVNIDYSKSDRSYYEKIEAQSKEKSFSKTSEVGGLDPEFLQSLKNNFGANAEEGYNKGKSHKREVSLPLEYDDYEDYDNFDGYDDYDDEYEGFESANPDLNRRGGYTHQSGTTVKAKIRPVSGGDNYGQRRRETTTGNGYPKSEKATYNKNRNNVKNKKKEKGNQTMRYNDYADGTADAVPIKKKKKKKRVLMTIFIIILILLLGVLALAYYFVDKYSGLFNYVPTGERLDIENVHSDEGVFNILLIGTDARGSSNGLSDSVILVSINKDSKEIVMSSFMRDSYVQIPGQESETWHKLNWAHSHGGAELLMDTLEYNFGIEIDYYARVNFFSFAEIIDAVGGLDIEITDAEAVAMQSPMAEQNNIFGNEWGTDYLYEGGSYHMNGNQALAYSRIRKGVGDDFARTDRQREVIGLIADKAKEMSVSELDDLAELVLPNITTNMEKKTIKSLMTKIPVYLGYEQVSQRVPYGDNMESWSYGSSADGSIIVVDFDLNRKRLMETIYKE